MYAIEKGHQTYGINIKQQIKQDQLWYLKQILKLNKLKRNLRYFKMGLTIS